MSFAQRERHSLIDLLGSVGPDAPTLCEGWTTADLAAHLFVRENRPRALPGMSGGRFADVAEREMTRALDELGYEGILTRLADGPPALMQFADAAMNTIEYFVHHEDVRRAGVVESDAYVRPLSEADRVQLARRLGMMAAAVPAPDAFPTYLHATDLPEPLTWKLCGATGPVARRVVGPVGEVTLWLLGRRDHARVSDDLRALP